MVDTQQPLATPPPGSRTARQAIIAGQLVLLVFMLLFGYVEVTNPGLTPLGVRSRAESMIMLWLALAVPVVPAALILLGVARRAREMRLLTVEGAGIVGYFCVAMAYPGFVGLFGQSPLLGFLVGFQAAWGAKHLALPELCLALWWLERGSRPA